MSFDGRSLSGYASVLILGVLLALGVGGCDDSGGEPTRDPDEQEGDDLTAHLPLGTSNLARLVADPVRPYVYASDRAANAVHFVSTETYLVERTIAVGSSPGAMDLKPDGSSLFVALHGASSIAVVDLSAGTLAGAITLPGTPEAIAVGSNDRLYVSIRGQAVYEVDLGGAGSGAAVVDGTWRSTVAGATGDRAFLFTHDASTSLGLTKWSISAATAEPVATAEIVSGPPLISSSPDGATFAFVQNASYFDTRWPLDDGDVPIFRTDDLLRAGTVNVEWNPLAVAICPVTGSIVVAHDDVVVNPTDMATARHGQGAGDLHVFDGVTYTEAARHRLRDRVAGCGITCGPDGRIYVILGAGRGTAIGVIEP